MVDSAPASVVCRAIEERDLPNVLDCLMRGFPERRRDFWTRGLARLGARPPVADYPRYGHLLEVGGRVVGVLLQIFTIRETPSGRMVRCNMSSWCVDPDYRSYAHPLHARAVARREVTYLTVTAAPHTVAALKAFGYRASSEGQVIFAPLLSRSQPGARVVEYAPGRPEAARLSGEDARLLADHAALGCIALIGLAENDARPLIFQPRTIWRTLIPCVHVIYCREASDLTRFGFAYGRHLARRGRFFVLADALGPIPGLAGRYVPGREPRYYKGPQPPSPLDLADTELVILGR
jgi:hypothetical protein